MTEDIRLGSMLPLDVWMSDEPAECAVVIRMEWLNTTSVRIWMIDAEGLRYVDAPHSMLATVSPASRMMEG